MLVAIPTKIQSVILNPAYAKFCICLGYRLAHFALYRCFIMEHNHTLNGKADRTVLDPMGRTTVTYVTSLLRGRSMITRGHSSIFLCEHRFNSPIQVTKGAWLSSALITCPVGSIFVNPVSDLVPMAGI